MQITFKLYASLGEFLPADKPGSCQVPHNGPSGSIPT
jgi:hypothetical protein